MATKQPPSFDHARHAKFWLRCSTLLPQAYTSGDANRMSLGFFIVAALDLLGTLPSIPATERQAWVRWIYSLQCPEGGFRGFSGSNLGARRDLWNKGWDGPSLANSFLALVTLLILGDDLVRVKRPELAQWVRGLQRPCGGFTEEAKGGDSEGRDDMRMCYCAAGIAYILGDVEIVDMGRLRRFVGSSQAYEGGVGQGPGLEGHSGLNFCALGCLQFLKRLEGDEKEGKLLQGSELDAEECIRYMCMRQTTWVDDESDDGEEDEDQEKADERSASGQTPNMDEGICTYEDSTPMAGFNGRTNKMADTCYCFWNLGALAILGKEGLADLDSLRGYLCEKTQHRIGGFSKTPGEHPDLMHSYLGLATLALMNTEGLKRLDPVLCAGVDMRKRVEGLTWRGNGKGWTLM